MAEIQTHNLQPPSVEVSTSVKRNGQQPKPNKKDPSVQQVYALPTPIKTFPLPAFHPTNPVSLFHVAYAWLNLVFRPPPTEPAIVHNGLWSAATGSVHVTDPTSIRALWEQGFYGKGNLSRSEPNWLKREQVRRGLEASQVSELLTNQRREERNRAKWERARLEQEAIRETRLEEARRLEQERIASAPQASKSQPIHAAPVGPLELLALPNSQAELVLLLEAVTSSDGLGLSSARQVGVAEHASHGFVNSEAVVVVAGTGKVIPSLADIREHLAKQDAAIAENKHEQVGVLEVAASPPSPPSSTTSETKSVKCKKSVRFSPKIQSTTFQLGDPPSPSPTPSPQNLNSKHNQVESANGSTQIHASGTETIMTKEHLQLTTEEALFLSFGLGVLNVGDPARNGRILSVKELLTLFGQYSSFPAKTAAEAARLQPDDGFLVHYSVYHHFRSLGWVPRAGTKFGVDWLLYTRGPVFDHASFGLIVIPSYSDPEWKRLGKASPDKSWSWLHSTVRVLSHVMKNLALVYVDIPPPSRFEEVISSSFVDTLKLYTVREIMVKRWAINRNR